MDINTGLNILLIINIVLACLIGCSLCFIAKFLYSEMQVRKQTLKHLKERKIVISDINKEEEKSKAIDGNME